MRRFLILGQNYSPLANKILESGDDYLLMQDQSVHFSSKIDRSRVIETNFSDMQDVLDKAVSYADMAGIITIYEQYVLPLAKISLRLAKPALSIDSAEACTDKALMRQKFIDYAPEISPAFCVVNSRADLNKFAKKYGYPLIIKPAHLSKSLLISKCSNQEELELAYSSTVEKIKGVYEKYASSRKPKIIVEQFMEGPQYSVDAFVDKSGKVHLIDHITPLQTGYDVGFTDNFTYSRLFGVADDKKLKAEMLRVSRLGIEALGISSSAAFVQLVQTENGPKIIEIAARIGGYRARAYGLSAGLDMLANVINLSQALPIDTQIKKQEPCAVIELFPEIPGKFSGIKNEANLRKLKSLNYLNIKAKEGNLVGMSSSGHKATAVIILHNSDKKQFFDDYNFVSKNVRVQTS